MSEENNVMDLDAEENIIELEDMDGNKASFEFAPYFLSRPIKFSVAVLFASGMNLPNLGFFK